MPEESESFGNAAGQTNTSPQQDRYHRRGRPGFGSRAISSKREAMCQVFLNLDGSRVDLSQISDNGHAGPIPADSYQR